MKHDVFYMWRHAETENNKDGIISSNETVLSDNGEKQSREARAVFDALFPNPEMCYLVRSELPRARQTAEFMNPYLTWHPDSRLNELNNGELGGRITLGEAQARLHDHRAGKKPLPASVERLARHTERVVRAVIDHAAQCPEDKIPVFLSHHLSMEHVAAIFGIEGCKFKNAAFYSFERNKQTRQWSIFEISLQEGKIHKHLIGASPQGFQAVTAPASESRIILN